MPTKKKTTTKVYKKSTAKGKTAAKKTTKKGSSKKTELSTVHYIMPWILGAFSLYLAICLYFTNYSGDLGKLLHHLFLGLFGAAGFIMPFMLGVIAFFWIPDAKNFNLIKRAIFGTVVLLSLSALIHSFGEFSTTFNMGILWDNGITLKCGGAIGGLVGSALKKLIYLPGIIIITLPLMVIFGIFFVGLTPAMVGNYLSNYFTVKKEEYQELKKEKEKEKEKQRALHNEKPEAYLPEEEDFYTPPQRVLDMNEPVDDSPKVDPEIFERIKNEINQTNEIDVPKFKKDEKPYTGDQVNLDEVYLDEDEQELIRKAAQQGVLDIETKIVEDIPEEKPVKKEKPKYVFPPITLLSQAKKPENEDITEELRSNANKLVETLASFKVRTKIIDISRGPAITRYELQPEEGVRVRQIANLVDDIALNLATSGIRIEAPIPGKAAVGIEVPNKTRTVVGLREQLEAATFKDATSRLTASLGVDVAGEPIYMDIAKMPHLLVAGATGQGKSVCINSIIVSILYKATPDEVKLILIDPKKVEFVPYNGLPHLLVPVVTDPKKAAGSLQWAVGEMERRYQLMESLGVRDIYNFNMKTKDDPTYEYIPQIVIIIDELADLMMTAPDQVEDSICRLAQKARAAGMHLILGTQRPSVDVVTGLIKANIPSRISCKTTSQVDSRTILDMAGAEKLIGRGDMLYAPVGAPKPMRVQGSFVHEDDVAKVTDFIRQKVGESEYDESVIEKIEQEAAKCGVKKGSGMASAGDIDDDDDADPMLKQAIELAVESGKISTSLIQRKLSLGYGRAAKLIDTMEKMGIVGAPEGNKPRQVLMTPAEFAEMCMSQE
ncbi:MAG: DNA translocase FtsK 4TM domain-containing protein [Clostridia bacterium]|nr:DNA translocase FtsK 4TM domain-containing protein [Clostridia bacterium]